MIDLLKTRLGLIDETEGLDWTAILVLFFRVMAVVQLLKGLLHWTLLLGSAAEPFTGEDLEYQAANIYFAVLDPVAGVGLWMTSSWGAVLWLLAAISQIAVCVGFIEVYGIVWPLLAFELIVIAVYIYLTWRVAQISDE
ncbi:DUF6163 family protein [Terrihabitans sp. B22-R8]|uniref:DUF6163 family protein n=1 Tax=Terrihabitans sp. B22-R8 TaxID=3425128 RepID=UPI00403C5FC5